MSQAPTPPFDNPLSFASCSIGLPRHTLEQKLDAIAAAGFNGIELSFPDLQSFANRHLDKGDVAEDDYASLCEAGKLVRALCDRKELQIMVLQPFANFEGWPRGSKEREDAFARARGWMEIMTAVGTDMLQVGSSDSPGISSSFADLAADLAELADLLATRGFRIAYENWCWATHAPSWKDVWDIVRLADRPNLGLCLDTFQSAGGEFGDPTTASGRIEAGGLVEEELRSSYESSLRELTKTVPSEKIYFLQISDAYKVEPPLGTEADAEGLRPRGRWSHDHRPLPYDGGYLPIVQFLEAVMGTGFRGWLSVEVFDGKFEDKYGDDLKGYAVKGREAVAKMLGDMTLDKSGY
ncbi:Putative xylose isomerase-like, TIM barrel domain, xylose isomerase-like superfamily [Colletotrichum destructivum]|uniref:Xylose isomerase-like, TIM barrel domain, xylose isomerase-like superfamily n=1 Tax=Colletotrichum destructivum TaxID=34406 RepID=A0AAX4I0D4_9PEZI|nr:Putative xylose isomerase-like, TIM barrel domain, xylose isomerase-like superfamily [Colletotrichum destructivum]